MDSRRQTILEAARRLLHHYGPNKTTVADIAREAHVGIGTVYLEFRSKDSIIAELSKRFHDDMLDAMRAICDDASRSFADRLTGVMEARVRMLHELADRGAHAPDLAIHCCSATGRALARYRDEERRLVHALLSRAAASGDFAVDDVAGAANAVLLAYSRFGPPFVYQQPRAQVRAALGGMHRLVLRGLLARR